MVVLVAVEVVVVVVDFHCHLISHLEAHHNNRLDMHKHTQLRKKSMQNFTRENRTYHYHRLVLEKRNKFDINLLLFVYTNEINTCMENK